MITIPKLLTFKQFLDFDDSNELNEYELVAGGLVLVAVAGGGKCTRRRASPKGDARLLVHRLPPRHAVP